MSDFVSPRLPDARRLSADRSTITRHNPALNAESEKWFELMVKVQPHHTDYAGVVWHGNYLQWLETGRVEYLHSIGIDFAELVKLGCDLPVVDLSLRYHRPIRLGQTAVVKIQMQDIRTVRLELLHRVECLETRELCVTGKVTLVAVDPTQGKILRRLPPKVKAALVKLYD